MALSRFFAPDIVYPLERAWRFARCGLWPRVCGVLRASSVAAENVSLRRENDALKMACAELARLEAENARLRRALDYRARNFRKWLCAGVLSTGGGAVSVRDVVRIDKGSLSGVRKGAVVVVPEGLVGRVSSVSPTVSEVMLLTDPSLKVACEVVSGGSRVRGILSGGGDDRLSLLHLRDAGRVRPDARVRTSGLGGVFPGGLEIGVLVSLTNGVRGLEGEVRPGVDFSSLEDVFVCRDD